MSRSRTSLLAATVLAVTLAATACGAPVEEESSTATESSTPSAPATTDETTGTTPAETPSETPEEPAGPTLEVTVAGDTITPNAEEIDLAVGEPLLMTITSDRAGEFHVHSKPEQYVQFEAGTSTKELLIETPGVVEAEEHDSGAVVAVITVQ